MNTSLNVQLQELKSDDVSSVVRLMRSSTMIDHHSVYTLWQSAHYDPRLFITATIESKLVGYIFGRTTPNAVFLWQLCVDSICQGKGVGSLLVGQFLKNAKSVSGGGTVEFTVAESNAASLALFRSVAKKEGFDLKEIGETGSFGSSMKNELIFSINL